MATYFGPVAAHCPAASDQLGRDSFFRRILNSRNPFTRPNIPQPRDLESAIIAANIARSIVTDITNTRISNNTKERTAKDKHGKDKFRTTKSKWSEVRSQRIKQKYKYFAKNPDGSDDKATWVVMERIERMVWHDSGWKSNLVFIYGEKDGPSNNKGEPVGMPTFG